ncbi:hypothetical protein [Georgenia muralis]
MASDDSEQNPYTRPGFVVAALVMAVVLILAAVLGYRTLTGPDETDPSAQPTGTAPTTSAAPTETPSLAGGDSVCGLEAVELDGTLTAAPAETDWELVGTTAAPSVEGHGPGVVEDNGFRSCFAHTPTGALLAAANVAAMGSDPALTPTVAEHLFAEGPGRDAALSAPPTGNAGGGVRVQIAGFRVLNYAGTEASIDLALRGSNGVLGGQVFDLVWEDRDWKMQIAPDGQLPTDLAVLPDLTGYILWAGA